MGLYNLRYHFLLLTFIVFDKFTLMNCLVNFQAFYLPWAMLALDVIFGSPIAPDLCGILAGHLYYFLTVLHPLASGRNILRTPMWLYPFCLSDRLGCTVFVFGLDTDVNEIKK